MNNQTGEKQSHIKYYTAGIVAFAIWGFFSFVLKPLHAYASLDILFYRVFLCTAIMLVIAITAKRRVLAENIQHFKSLPASEKRNNLMLNIGGGIFLTGNWFFFIYVMNHISIKATSLAYLVCPILTTLLAFVFLKEKLNRLQWAAILLSAAGCLLLSLGHLMDMVFSMIVALSYALYLVSQRRNVGFDKTLVLTFHFLVSALLLLPLYPFFSEALPTSMEFYIYIGIISVLFTIIPLFLNLYALKVLTSSTVGMLLNINPIIGFIIAVTVFKEHIDQLQIIAYSIIFISVIIFNIRPRLRKQQPEQY
ncbi:EamA family transporter [Mucilaginibacter sp. JRF]|uniref:EamA family transporter n=1 Tax=Mucilaginibacter sp. JRF TaxID=2780088 RepID=UPI0018808C56|nr:EamA family transporter [Mucilaginibacter sp. JRF]MBE9583488.1 EamA family transporter [Mucilaginibacter sp. JRF]